MKKRDSIIKLSGLALIIISVFFILFGVYAAEFMSRAASLILTAAGWLMLIAGLVLYKLKSAAGG